ncbi:type II toxin-antitoxin system prevent-host-death family antitoxin [Chthonobacter rhizosphaerae]|uniref:type II toxin-antitoxin system prevent-host-death family antitoxin n=1 Tax=Chthonobacter rhizosphaerae TaxID=2735553 RepID=UPI0015EF4605|nr:type II toxin-antitoxin system prevent-host-death family antitoxin [Chthonobacter rhizosphaerae]
MIRVAAEDFARDSATFLDRVEQGEEVWIEKNGMVVARLVSVLSAGKEASGPTVDPEASEAVRAFRRLRAGATLDGLDWKALRDEGRR